MIEREGEADEAKHTRIAMSSLYNNYSSTYVIRRQFSPLRSISGASGTQRPLQGPIRTAESPKAHCRSAVRYIYNMRVLNSVLFFFCDTDMNAIVAQLPSYPVVQLSSCPAVQLPFCVVVLTVCLSLPL